MQNALTNHLAPYQCAGLDLRSSKASRSSTPVIQSTDNRRSMAKQSDDRSLQYSHFCQYSLIVAWQASDRLQLKLAEQQASRCSIRQMVVRLFVCLLGSSKTSQSSTAVMQSNDGAAASKPSHCLVMEIYDRWSSNQMIDRSSIVTSAKF
jgi:hypothetical protein